MRLFSTRFLEAEGAEGEGWGARGVSGAVLWAYGNPRGLSGSLGSPWLAFSRTFELVCVVRCTPLPCSFPLKFLFSCACTLFPAPTPPKGPKIGFPISCPNPFPRPTSLSKVMAETVSEPAPSFVPSGLSTPLTPKAPLGFVFFGFFSVHPDRKVWGEGGTHLCVFCPLGWGATVGLVQACLARHGGASVFDSFVGGGKGQEDASPQGNTGNRSGRHFVATLQNRSAKLVRLHAPLKIPLVLTYTCAKCPL